MAAGRQRIDKRGANIRVTAAAIPEQEGRDLSQVVEISPIDDRAAASLGSDHPSPGEDAQVPGHGVVWDGELAGDVAGRKPIRFVLHQQPEHVETGGLGKSRENENGAVCFHMSRCIE